MPAGVVDETVEELSRHLEPNDITIHGDKTGLKEEEKQRILGIVPARNIVLSEEAPP